MILNHLAHVYHILYLYDTLYLILVYFDSCLFLVKDCKISE